MNWRKGFQTYNLIFLLGLAGCGVKGDPEPPEHPVSLGRGRPTYRRATEKIKLDREKNREESEDDDE